MLDLILTNEEYMIENLRYVAPLGKSDHACLLWIFITYSRDRHKDVSLRINTSLRIKTFLFA